LPIFPFHLRIAKIEKEEKTIISSYVDSKRRNLDPVVIVHTTCGECYNSHTLRDCYGINKNLDIPIFNEILGLVCRGCGEQFQRYDTKKLFAHFVTVKYQSVKEMVHGESANELQAWDPFRNV
jgi:hypothetical protein